MFSLALVSLSGRALIMLLLLLFMRSCLLGKYFDVSELGPFAHLYPFLQDLPLMIHEELLVLCVFLCHIYYLFED